jgi:hypothetical protein
MAVVNTLWAFVQQHALLILILIGLAGFLAIHLVWYIRPSAVASLDDLDRRLRSGQPTLIQLYSNL